MSALPKDVTKQFGNFTAVDNVDLDVPHGTFVCLLGPSGCGKTTLLRMIAGLEEPTSGRIARWRRHHHRPAHKRNFGMVFQSLALFPHLTVGDNIAYPLAHSRGAPRRGGARRRPARCSSIFPASPTARYRKLSGGQRQRVAIARALPSATTVPARRAVVGARRQAARGDAGGTAPVAATARHHHHRRHP